MQVKDIMTRDTQTVREGDSTAAAGRQMREANVGCLVVIGGAVKGIVTDRDLAISCLGDAHNAEECPVSRHMSTPAITVDPSLDILEAVHLMTESRVKRLPVVESDQLIGLVSLREMVFRYIPEKDDAEA